MATLLQCIDSLIDKISVTDRQEDNIAASLRNIEGYLLEKENDLDINKVFTNGSYERDTIIRPLDDIDIFAVLDFEEWKDENSQLPKPQSVLTKIKNYLNGLHDYKDKVKQDRPCVTIEISDKSFDILPAFPLPGNGYWMPNDTLSGWTSTYPEQLTTDLDAINKYRKGKVKPIIKAIKYWNRELGKIIPSYHIEETAIRIFQVHDFKNYEEGIRLWFENAEYYLQYNAFATMDKFTAAKSTVQKTRKQLAAAKKALDDADEAESIKIWKEIFGREFPTVSTEEAKQFSEALSAGELKIGAAGALSTSIGSTIRASKGFYGEDVSKS